MIWSQKWPPISYMTDPVKSPARSGRGPHLHAVPEGLFRVVRPGVQAALAGLLGQQAALAGLLGQQGGHGHQGERLGGRQVDVGHIVVGPAPLADPPPQALLQQHLCNES